MVVHVYGDVDVRVDFDADCDVDVDVDVNVDVDVDFEAFANFDAIVGDIVTSCGT